jgi:hypothetical protein
MLKLLRKKSQAFRKNKAHNIGKADNIFHSSQPRHSGPLLQTFAPVTEEAEDDYDE